MEETGSKIEPIFDSDYGASHYDVENCNNLNIQQDENHLECEACTKLFNTKHKFILHKKKHIGKKTIQM